MRRAPFILLALALPGAWAQQPTDAPATDGIVDPLAGIEFPVEELGGCTSREACAAYCDTVSHFPVCTDFANARGLTAAQVKAPIRFPVEELGGCGSPSECRTFCEQPTALAACLDFAVKNNVIDKAKADEAKLVIPHFVAGSAPGGCTSELTCQTYCESPEKLDECLDFGLRVGAITEEEARAARSIKEGGGPGGCTTRLGCKAYCDDPENRYVCFTYAKDHGLISEEEARVGQRFFDRGGVGPAGCVSKTDCVDTCNDPANFDACVEFAHDLGIINDDDWKAAQIIRDAGGPGGCQTKAQCESYCSAPENQAECGRAFGMNSVMALGGAIPAPCVEDGLDPAACRAYCEQDREACAAAGAPPPGSLPPVCENAGATTGEACLALCSQPPYPCGGAPPLGFDQPAASFPAACVAVGATTPGACMEYCSQPPHPCGGPSPEGVGAPGADQLALPPECRALGLEGVACGEYCGTPGNACTGAGGAPAGSGIEGAMPSYCTDAGIVSLDRCMAYCNEPPYPCGGAAPPGTTPEMGSAGLPAACVAAGVAGADCTAYCATSPLACAPEGSVPTTPTAPTAIPTMPTGIPTMPTGIPTGYPTPPTGIPTGYPTGPPSGFPFGG